MELSHVVVEVWVLVDGDGNFVVHHDQDGIKERYEEEVGDDWGKTTTRLVRATIHVPRPKLADVIAVVDEEPAVGAAEVA